MATHSVFGEFIQGQEDWTAYCERLEQYMVANDIQDVGKKRAILLSACGAATYQLIRNLVAPGKPTDHTFEQLVKQVTDHLTPPPSAIMQRYKFNSRAQKDGETVADYVAELRRLSEHCKFDSLDEMLRDRLVCGIRDVRVQRRLLAEADLDFKKAFEFAQAAEVADTNAKVLQKPSPAAVHAVPSAHGKSARSCDRCGGNHSKDDCRFKDAECHFCRKKGHIAKVCRSKAKSTTSSRQQRNRPKTKSTQRTCQVSEETEDDASYNLFAVRNERASPPIEVTVQVNGTDLVMEVDTGATSSIISEATYKRLWP